MLDLQAHPSPNYYPVRKNDFLLNTSLSNRNKILDLLMEGVVDDHKKSWLASFNAQNVPPNLQTFDCPSYFHALQLALRQ